MHTSKIIFINPKSPGAPQTFLGGPLIAILAQLTRAGYEVKFLDQDFETDNALTDEHTVKAINHCDIIEIYMDTRNKHEVATLVKELEHHKKPFAVSGPGAEASTKEEFQTLFAGADANVTQISKPSDRCQLFGSMVHDFPDPYHIDYVEVWKNLGEAHLREYLPRGYAFCTHADKMALELKPLEILLKDIVYLAGKAEKFGLEKLHLYVGSLAFFKETERRHYLRRIKEIERGQFPTLKFIIEEIPFDL